MAEDKLSVSEKTGGDAAHAIAKAGLSAIPLVGGPAAELFQYIVQPPLEKRRVRWMVDVGEKLKELEVKGLSLESLQSNEQFVTAILHASRVALLTHQASKLDALRNAILNVAKGRAPDETLQHLFFGFVGSLTEQHLQILKIFQAPTPPPNTSMGGLGHVLEHNIPELRNCKELYTQLWRDLYSRGLLNTDGLNVTISGNGLSAKRTTNLGDDFLKFIAEAP